MKHQQFNLRLITLTFFSVLIFIGCKNNDTTSPKTHNIKFDNKTEVDSIVDQYIDDGLFPVMYARVEDKKGNVLYEHGNINAELFPGKSVAKDSWFRVWSMCKIITISITMDLVEDGIIKLSDPVTKYIPEFENLKVAVNMDGKSLSDQYDEDEKNARCPFKLVPMESEMTILDLINHKAGFYYATTGLDCIDDLIASKNLGGCKSNQEFIDKLASLPLIQQPGTNAYYGINTTVLGFVNERATGKSLKDLVKERITDPLKIEGLQYGLDESKLLIPPVSAVDTTLRIAHHGELDIFGPDVPTYDPSSPLYLGGEGMVATADGYADFVRMLINGGTLNGHRFLDEATVKEISSPHTHLDNEYGYNGYNLWVSSDSLRAQGKGDGGLWIGGGYEGTHFWGDPKRGIVGVFMTQIFQPQPEAGDKDGTIRGALYKSLLKEQ